MLQALGKITRLKGFFRSGINYSCYEEMANAAERKASGCLPKDILSCLISGNPDKKVAIKGTEKIFSDAVDILGEVNKLEKQAINRMPQNPNYAQRMLYFLLKGDIKRFLRFDSIYREKELETIIRAEEKILTEIKKYIPETQNVIITPLGCGMFGNGYKLQVFGKNGQKVFNDKVLKVYRENYLGQTFQERSKRYIDNLSDERLIEQFNKERELYKKKGITIPEKTPEEIRKLANENADFLEKSVVENKKIHGAFAEANISEFLRFFSGHKIAPKDGIAIPSFFGLGETKFSLGDFIDKGTRAEKKFNFERLFLQHQDFELNAGNGINGICIDMGGIIPLSGMKQGSGVLFGKQNMRVIKSLFSYPKEKREIVLEEYKKSGTLSNEVLTQLEQIMKAA